MYVAEGTCQTSKWSHLRLSICLSMALRRLVRSIRNLCQMSTQEVTTCFTSASSANRLPPRSFLRVQRDGKPTTHTPHRLVNLPPCGLNVDHSQNPDLPTIAVHPSEPLRKHLCGKRFARDANVQLAIIAWL